MLLKSLIGLSTCLMASSAWAQSAEAPSPTTYSPKWQIFAEAGPKFSQFRNTYHSTNNVAFVPSGYVGEYSRDFHVDNTYAAFAGAKALRYLSKHLVASGGAGLDMQQLDFTTSTRSQLPPFRTSRGEHVVRLLTRLRVDAGLHAALGLGSAGQLMPGVSLGQMINVSKSGYSYSFV